MEQGALPRAPSLLHPPRVIVCLTFTPALVVSCFFGVCEIWNQRADTCRQDPPPAVVAPPGRTSAGHTRNCSCFNNDNGDNNVHVDAYVNDRVISSSEAAS